MYPSFETKMKNINLQAFRFSLLITFFVTLNFLLSCVHVLRDYSEGKSSATAIVSYSMLLLPRVLGWLINAHKAHTEGQPLSFFIKISALPNTIDADWRYRPEVYRCALIASRAMHGMLCVHGLVLLPARAYACAIRSLSTGRVMPPLWRVPPGTIRRRSNCLRSKNSWHLRKYTHAASQARVAGVCVRDAGETGRCRGIWQKHGQAGVANSFVRVHARVERRSCHLDRAAVRDQQYALVRVRCGQRAAHAVHPGAQRRPALRA